MRPSRDAWQPKCLQCPRRPSMWCYDMVLEPVLYTESSPRPWVGCESCFAIRRGRVHRAHTEDFQGSIRQIFAEFPWHSGHSWLPWTSTWPSRGESPRNRETQKSRSLGMIYYLGSKSFVSVLQGLTWRIRHGISMADSALLLVEKLGYHEKWKARQV